MLGIFFLLVWVTVIAALTSHDHRNRARLSAGQGNGNGMGPLPPGAGPGRNRLLGAGLQQPPLQQLAGRVGVKDRDRDRDRDADGQLVPAGYGGHGAGFDGGEDGLVGYGGGGGGGHGESSASHVDQDFKTALAKHDHPTLCRYYRLALQRELPVRDEQLVRINLACSLNGIGEHRQALEELDRVSLPELYPSEVALWLNNRAYTLTFLGRPADAIDNLKDADELLSGDDGLSRDPLLSGCIAGTRGIAHFHLGELEAAERCLRDALKKEEEGVALQFDPEWQTDPARTSERWYWLGEIAKRQGDNAEAARRFQRAAAHSATEYGKKAQKLLQALKAAENPPRRLILTSA